MKRYWFLTRMLVRNLRLCFSGWWSFVKADLDEFYCCPGTREYECGCGGITNREAFELETEYYE
jgi:hypothetical protein